MFDERAFVEGYQPQHKFLSLVIPPTLHHEILNIINDFELLQIRDLLLELIASAQDIYIRDVAFWERPENQKLITSAEKETEKAIQVIEQSGIDWKSLEKYDNKPFPKLDHIKFVFNNGTIKLEHEWLAKEFIENMKRAYDDLHYKNWKKDLARYPLRFDENAHKSKFKYRLAKSYYNLLTKIKSFKVTESTPYPNQLMLCIAKLIEFSLIPVGDWADSDDVKVKHIRNWLKRNDLEPKLTFAEVPADLEKLKQYFEPNFLEMANATKRADAISVAFFICQRFDIQDLLPELIHIASCITETNWLVGHQMTSNSKMNEPVIPEMNAFRQLMNGIKDKKKLTSLKFTLEGKDGEQELSSRLPLYLIEEALKEYYHSDQIEFDSDVIPTTYKKNEDGCIKIEKTAQFNLPHERHLVRLVHSLYNYLKEHSGIEEGEILPGEKYYEIIGILFKEAWVFYNKMVDDRSVVEKIKQWHQLRPES
ncbi:hypothetical protein PZB74_12310 [Porifericola rhodea]|uniref:hypothetical protein n=1 Tax=Porifericola rhodea TaxID=930972 RepID=UPI002665F20C|nr:hypothetical protein [Porifericola rhodea]WKN29749.1 hypothetical protein PZB74_12310 [Porifericola rhodea]